MWRMVEVEKDGLAVLDLVGCDKHDKVISLEPLATVV